jgi:O-antigen/teichoic acid export membrane protein
MSLATVLVISRRLAVGSFGTYSFAVAYAAFFVFFTDLGLDAVTTRELAAHPVEEEGRILGSALVAKAVLVALAVAGSLAALFIFGSGLRVPAALSVIGLLAAVPGTPALLLNARVRVVGATVIQLVGSVLTLVGTIAVLHLSASPNGPIIVMSAATVAVGLGLAGLARLGATVRMTFDPATMRRILRGAAPVALALVGVVIYRRADQLLMGGLGQIRDLARYAAAVRIVDALNIVPLAVATIALPALTHFQSLDAADAGREPRAGRLAAVGYRLLAALILPVAALATYAGGPIMSLAFGSSYRSAGTALAILLWAHYFGFTGVMVDQVLIARRQSRHLAVLTLCGAVLNVAIDLWAIPRYGGVGAAWASLVAYAVPFVAGSLVRPVRDVFRSCLLSSVRPAIAAGVVLITLVVSNLRGAPVLVVFVAASAVALVVTGSVSVTEVREMVASAVRRDSGSDASTGPGT